MYCGLSTASEVFLIFTTQLYQYFSDFFLFELFSDKPEVFLPKYSQTAILHVAHFWRVVNQQLSCSNATTIFPCYLMGSTFKINLISVYLGLARIQKVYIKTFILLQTLFEELDNLIKFIQEFIASLFSTLSILQSLLSNFPLKLPYMSTSCTPGTAYIWTIWCILGKTVSKI